MHAAAVQEEAGPSLHGGSGAERLPAPQPQDGQSLVRELDANIHVHRYVRGLFTKRKGFKGGRRAETRCREGPPEGRRYVHGWWETLAVTVSGPCTWRADVCLSNN